MFCVMTSDAAPGVIMSGLEASCPRLERQHDLAGVARDHRVDVILVDRALERAHRLGRGRMVVVGDDLDLASVDAALGVDLVGGDLGGLRDRGARDRLGLGDDADLDRSGIVGQGRRGDGERESGRSGAERAAQNGRARAQSRMASFYPPWTDWRRWPSMQPLGDHAAVFVPVMQANFLPGGGARVGCP